MKTNPEQQQRLDSLARKNTQIKLHRLEARLRIEKLLEQELNVLLVEQSQLANEALKAGVSKTKIGRAMGTTNWGTIEDVLNLTAESIRLADEAAVASAIAAAVEGPNGDWTYHPDTKILVLHHWRENGTMGRWRTDDLELQMKDTGHGTLAFTEYSDDITRRTKLEMNSVGEFENAVNVAMGFRKPQVDPYADNDSRDDFWANYTQKGPDDDEDVETEA